MVRPIANRRRTACGTAGPTTSRSAPRSMASSTSAAPTSRAWSSTGSSVTFAVLGDRLGHVEDALGLLGPTGDVGVERQRPVDLDDVDAR